jgi:prepilin-type N-terminal cleavage/methylation domain-containing protein
VSRRKRLRRYRYASGEALSAVRRIRVRGGAAASSEGGYTLVEMLVTMVVMGIVMGSLASIFVSGQRVQYSLNQSFVAQQSARTALDGMRTDIHCASTAVATTINTYPGLVLAVSNCSSTTPTVDYCVVPSTEMTGRYALWRSPTNTATTCTPSDTGRVKLADYLVPVGSPASTSNILTTPTTPNHAIPSIAIDLKVTIDPHAAKNIFELRDSIVTRNGTRCTSTSGC